MNTKKYFQRNGEIDYIEDTFLSKILKVSVYKITRISIKEKEENKIQSFFSEFLQLFPKHSKIDLRIDAEKYQIVIRALLKLGFQHIVTDLSLVLDINQFSRTTKKNTHINVQRVFPPFDSMQITETLRHNKIFSHSRFFMDPNITPDKGIEIYETWIKNSFNGYTSHNFVAKSSEKIIGFATLHKKTDHLWLDLIGKIDSQEKGIGTQLMEDIVNYCKQERIPQIKTGTQASNVNAINFYLRKGFIITKSEQFMTYVKRT